MILNGEFMENVHELSIEIPEHVTLLWLGCFPRPSTAPGTMLRPRVESPAGASKLKTLGNAATALDVAS